MIEIRTRTVIEAPLHCRYAAVSCTQTGEKALEEGLESPPAVIQDALAVCASLGLGFLWVDRFCIPQSPQSPEDRELKHRMINQMDQIYSSAYLTIVAAAGQDVHAGLPGVSRFHRRQLQEAHIGDIHFVQLPRPGLATIMSSHWASRGWTFQECYLSGRRLIFTEDQTLFLCNKSFVAESARPQICTAGPLSLQFGHLIRRPKMSGDAYGQLLEQVQEYSRRNISYDRDSLNAFLGVLHQWETRLAWTNEPISHLWGLPRKGTITHGPDSVEFYVLWSHTRHDAVHRPEFPSWSWAGWVGRKDFLRYPIHLDGTEQEQN